MAREAIVIALDSGALVLAEKGERVEAVMRKYLREGASFVIPAPVLAESMRGSVRDAAANRLVKAVGNVTPTTEHIARRAGERLGKARSSSTVDALVVVTAESCGATDMLTTDTTDIRRLASGSFNIIHLT